MYTRPCNSVLEARRGEDVGKEWSLPISSSDPIVDRKSIFEGHASCLPTLSHLPSFLAHTTSSKRTQRATHRMYAYRTFGSAMCGQEDGGEGGSGERLARLLELNQCENVVVVVFRWYGGVKLGSDRWKRISQAGKEALVKGGFVKEKVKKGRKKR